jgi:hypothetical protein
MSFIYSQALVEEFSRGKCSGTDVSAQSSGSPTPRPCLWHDRTMEPSRLSRFGMTCKPSTDDHGTAMWTWLREASHAKTSVSRGGVQVLTENAQACGTTWPASLAKYDPASHTLKTAQLSLIEDLTGCSVTLPRSGLMRDGECYQLPMLVPPICESASGYWRTPNANVIEAKSTVVKLTGRKPSDPQVGLADQVMARERARWATPSASDATRGGTLTDNMTGQSLVQMVNTPERWPTPTVCGNHNRKGASPNSGDGLATAVKMYPTATATATAHKGWSPNHNRADSDDRLDYTVEREGFSPGQQTPPMRLNPAWVEWLMGWPIGHTELKPLATDKFREWQQQHSIY